MPLFRRFQDLGRFAARGLTGPFCQRVTISDSGGLQSGTDSGTGVTDSVTAGTETGTDLLSSQSLLGSLQQPSASPLEVSSPVGRTLRSTCHHTDSLKTTRGGPQGLLSERPRRSLGRLECACRDYQGAVEARASLAVIVSEKVLGECRMKGKDSEERTESQKLTGESYWFEDPSAS